MGEREEDSRGVWGFGVWVEFLYFKFGIVDDYLHAFGGGS
jgi:hypothetical protein